jgi:hypothetical protein
VRVIICLVFPDVRVCTQTHKSLFLLIRELTLYVLNEAAVTCRGARGLRVDKGANTGADVCDVRIAESPVWTTSG